MRRVLMMSGLAVVVAAAVASAAVTFDPATGSGFVGKGDVQLALGLNNKQVQTTALTFTYSSVDTADVTCEWDTVTGGKFSKTIHHVVVNQKEAAVNSTVAYDARIKNQITGYSLTGFSSVSSSGSIPEIGGACPNSNDGVVTDVVATGSTGGLFVNGVRLQ